MSLHDLQNQYPELYGQLAEIADKRTIPFCYLCYIDAPNGRCSRCGTDDLMQRLPGVGVEYGYQWVIEHLLDQEVNNISENEQEKFFREFIGDYYGEETTVAYLSVNTGLAIKKLDPTAFGLRMSEYFMEDAHIEIRGKLYCISVIEMWVNEQLAKSEETISEEVVT